MTRCAACGHQNRDAARFCEECEALLARRCADCGSELRLTAKFCNECATPVVGTQKNDSSHALSQLRRADVAALARAGQALIRAQELIDETGAQLFQPELHECRAHLARLRGDALAAQREVEEARRLYADMGATAQAERLARELGT